MNPAQAPRVLVISGYFDWFSGYQETGLARALAKLADTTVLAGDRVSPIFSDEHLTQLGASRIYPVGESTSHGVRVKRLRVREARAMVWSPRAREAVEQGQYDLVVQIMPGQLLPIAASFARTGRRVVFYGDNAAMYASLRRSLAVVKYGVFAMTKGVLYRITNARADVIYGYTKDTKRRLRPFAGKHSMELASLTFDEESFYYSEGLRNDKRRALGLVESNYVVIAPGKVQNQKRLDALVDAVATMSAQDREDLILYIVGSDSGAVSTRLRKQVLEQSLEAVIRFVPFASSSDLNAYFNAADIAVWPAMPAITIQQAMGTGLLVAVPRNDFTDHLFTNPGSCVEIPQGSPLTSSLAGVLLSARSTREEASSRTQRAATNQWLSTRALATRLIADLGSRP